MRAKALFFPVMMSLLLSSCVHRDFEYESSHVTYIDVVFDWLNEPDANPGAMSLYLFPKKGGLPFRFEFSGRDGGTIRLEPGIYDAICINSDHREVVYRGESHSSFEITTGEAPALSFGSTMSVLSHDVPRAEGTADQTMSRQPPLLWSASVPAVSVDVRAPAKNRQGNQELRMFPVRIVDTYEVTVKKINNIMHLSSLGATISGVSGGVFAATRLPNDNAVTVPLTLNHNSVEATACGEFLTFGHCPAAQRPHKLMIYAILTDESKYYFEFDVSEQAHMPPDEHNVHHIIVELLDLPDGIGGGGSGGLEPTVDGWTSVGIGIDM